MAIDTIEKPTWNKSKPQEWVVAWTNSALKKSLISGHLLTQYNKLDGTLIEVRDVRDVTNYTSEYLLTQMFKIAQDNGYTDINVKYKKLDKNGNIISVWLQWKSPEHKGCIGCLDFIRNCSYWKNGWSNETCIIESFYPFKDTELQNCFDTEIYQKN